MAAINDCGWSLGELTKGLKAVGSGESNRKGVICPLGGGESVPLLQGDERPVIGVLARRSRFGAALEM
jgi:hypothetical protein